MLLASYLACICVAGSIADSAGLPSPPGEPPTSIDSIIVSRSLLSNATSLNYSDSTQFSSATQMALVRRTGSLIHFHWFQPLTTTHTLYANGNIVGFVPAYQNEFKLGGLVADAVYFLVLADPSGSSGDDAQILTASTTEPDAPDPPTSLEAATVSAGYAVISMDLPLNTGGVPLTTSLNCSVKHNFDEFYVGTTYSITEDDGDFSTLAQINGLDASTMYFLSCAVQNEAGYSSTQSASNIAFTTTAVTQPSRCDAPQVQNITGSRILSYRLFAAVNDSPLFDEIAVTSDPVLTLYQLEDGHPFTSNTTYSFRVVAENWAGLCYPPGDTSFLSDSLVVTFPEPSFPPEILPPYVTQAGASTLALQVVLADDMYGIAHVWGYVVQWKPTDGSLWNAVYTPADDFNSFRFVLTRLNASTSYHVRTILSTNLGYSSFSSIVVATTTPGVCQFHSI
ncbi:hypothetical protein DYB38_000108 [Aphanomyces astaci]|uniref:Fibronectin type-III domain-containing protein n=1 Tax=Aphanomyces astaci TaxID=112090 RepID=A0A397CJ80_APHAT|nr:hypothetical protein DYB38_000108 [Aphanomyces astaci]